MARQVLENGVILPAEYSDDWYDDMTSNLTKLDDVIGSDSEKLSSADVGAAALSNNYNDLDNLPTIPTVNDAVLTIQKNGVDVQTFTANASSNVTCNITVPTKTSDLTNDSNFVDTSNSAVASGITSAKVTSYDSHLADTDIHVTTADKNKWNNQTYVFRYSSTALVASSTHSNTLLDNTDNLKVGDKVIDSDGVLFSITAIDTANSTFTVGSALVDLALDANVVHTSGNETISGIKNFSDVTYIKSLNFTNEVASTSSSSSSIMPLVTTVTYTDQTASISARINLRITASGDKSLYPHENNQYALGLQSRKWSEVRAIQYYYGSSDTEFSQKFVTTDTNQAISGTKRFDNLVSLYGSYLGDEGSNNARTCSYSFSNRDTIGFSGVYQRRVRQNREQGQMSGSDISQYAFDILENQVRTNNVLYFVGRDFTNDIPKTMYIASQCNTRKLGSSLYPWSDTITNQINGLEPSALGMPDLANGVDISSYITVNGGNKESLYTPPVNGWISVTLTRTGGASMAVMLKQGSFASSGHNIAQENGTTTCNAMLPVKGGVQVSINSALADGIDFAYFYPCLGNV